MNTLTFCKMHGLGNDFMLVNALREPFTLKAPQIAKLADRNQGVGFDQLLVLRSSNKADLYCQIFNADGSEAEQCGNGLRCVARFIHEENILAKKALTIETPAGSFQLEIKDYTQIRVGLGPPIMKPEVTVKLGDLSAALTVLSLGNPHAIYRVRSCQEIPVGTWGAVIEKHPAFPQGVNAGFMEVLDRNAIRLRTYERGAGETLSCGSNACAAVIAGITKGWLDSRVAVTLSHGKLEVEWLGQDHPVFLTGPAERVFTGMIDIPFPPQRGGKG